MKYLFIAPIWFYRKFLSPLKPPVCRFRPTCSEYAILAFKRHGSFRGSYLTIWRILRCQPFCEGGHDPVPPSRHAPSGEGEEDPGTLVDPKSDLD